MVQRNYVIAIIIIALFIVLAIVGYAIYAIQNRVSLFAKKERDLDEEEAEQRTGIAAGAVKDRITSFENLRAISQEHSQRDLTPSDQITPNKTTGEITPPVVFCPRFALHRDWDVPSGRDMEYSYFDLPEMTSVDDEAQDLVIAPEELLTMNTPRSLPKQRGQRHTRPQSWAGPRQISRAASIMHEPEVAFSKTHTRAQSELPPSPSPGRLVPANSNPTMFPSAFRTVPLTSETERPGSSGSMVSTSTASTSASASDTCPATPPRNSWSSWAWNLPQLVSKKRARSPAPSPEKAVATVVVVTPTRGSTLSPLKPDADEFGLSLKTLRGNGVGAHWADVNASANDSPQSPDRKKRSVSRQVKWEDEESVNFSWF